MRLFKVLFILTLLALTAPECHAADAQHPLFDVTRASLAAGVDYAGYQQQGQQPLPDFKKAFEVGLYGAYVLTPHVTLTGSGAWDVDNKWIRWRVGVRTVLWKGRD
jgi:hypothetical protein